MSLPEYNISQLVPVMPSLDLEETEKFYTRILGFEKHYSSSEYMVMKKPNVWLHFWKCSDLQICHNSSFYMQIKGIEELYEFLESENVVHPDSSLETKFWGAKEVVIRDPHGNCITLSQAA